MTIKTNNSTHLADINELMITYYLNGKKWISSDAKKVYTEKKDKVSVEEHEDQVQRAQAMEEKFQQWAKSKGYSQVKKVHWVARPGALQKAVGKDIKINPKENPTDILIEFARGPAKGLLGISAKTTAIRGDVGFKNPGIGTIEEELKIDLQSIVNNKIRKAIDTYGLSEIAVKRKTELMTKKRIRDKVQILGAEATSEVIDAMLMKYKRMKQADLQTHLLKVWLNASEVFPPYVKVTGTGSDGFYSAKVEDVLKNDKMSAINNGRISMVKAGNETIAISAGGKHIMKIRAKFNDEKLASSFKFSADPWP